MSQRKGAEVSAAGIRPTVVDVRPEGNIADLLRERVQKTPDSPLFAVPNGDEWSDITAREFEEQVIAVAKGFVAAGVEPGEHVSLMSRVRYEWSLIDFALHYAGAIMVPVYETSSSSQMEWILSDGGSTFLLVESDELKERFDGTSESTRSQLRHEPWVIGNGAVEELTALGADVDDAEIERRRGLAGGSDVATIIYTSGSTAKPKGVVLTHSNFADLSRNAANVMKEVVSPGASTLLFVTLAHVFARFISVLAIEGGVKVGHQPDTTQLVPSLGSFKPTFLLVVPRVLEKVYNVSEQKAEGGGKGKIFRRAVEVAVEHSKALDAGKVPLRLALAFKLYDVLVYGKLKKALGGRAQYAVSGSAPLGLFLGHFYRSLGLRILEGYGLTETTAPITVNLPSKFKIGTVGPSLPGGGLRIAEDGEIEVSGIPVFKEYHNNPEATAEAFTEDGWFRTGDIGQLDAEDYLTITGRKKELIITAGGKNISPTQLEDPIRSNLLVEQVVVVGDQKPFIGAIVTLDTEMMPKWLANNGLDENMRVEDAMVHPKVVEELKAAVAKGNEAVSRAESIRRFIVLPVSFTEASGHLTPKMSIKRANIVKDFSAEIDSLYNKENPGGISL
ncbi:MAG: AMP-dependent synthetase/ligase [Agrococcus casei]|uniref:Acyl-CoA synthetase n=1 Tax=Agrococcus casei LMG 22410 TaxID=1255656 RepID=A0A1R4G670_9MICO|nr:AMP-dependent synthetase/ligase [Agrococcus casei]SJM63502.1 Long-chain-fatty-acid--CoA ligase [Agrococcus casei LMG 22410]